MPVVLPEFSFRQNTFSTHSHILAPPTYANAVTTFQKDAKYRVALLSLTAAGQGITLTAATRVIFAELHWTPGVLLQVCVR